MTNLREAAQMALEALEEMTQHFSFSRLGESRLADTTVRGKAHEAAEALRARLAQPEPEPVKCGCGDQIMPNDGAECGTCVTMRRAPQREWQSLTDEEIERLFVWQEWSEDFADYEPVARAIEAKLREKNS